MSYDRWPPTPDPQRPYDPPEDHLNGGYRYGTTTQPVDRPAPRPRRPTGDDGYGQGIPPGQSPRSHRPPGDGPRAQRRAAHRRVQQRRGRYIALVILVVLVGTIGFLILRGTGNSAPQADAQQTSGATGPASVQPTAATEPGGVPQTGPGTFAYATGTGKTLGSAGTLRRFQVAVEKETSQDANAFAATVDRILGDPRSWIAGGKSRFQRVPSGATHEFVIYLASPATSEKMCAAGGLHTDKYASCRLPGQVVINLARWLTGVPDYGAPLEVYQQYTINHEVGHQLGLYHEACPGPGQMASVMQQQTLGLMGCVANGWPYVNGVRVTGPPVP